MIGLILWNLLSRLLGVNHYSAPWDFWKSPEERFERKDEVENFKISVLNQCFGYDLPDPTVTKHRVVARVNEERRRESPLQNFCIMEFFL